MSGEVRVIRKRNIQGRRVDRFVSCLYCKRRVDFDGESDLSRRKEIFCKHYSDRHGIENDCVYLNEFYDKLFYGPNRRGSQFCCSYDNYFQNELNYYEHQIKNYYTCGIYNLHLFNLKNTIQEWLSSGGSQKGGARKLVSKVLNRIQNKNRSEKRKDALPSELYMVTDYLSEYRKVFLKVIKIVRNKSEVRYGDVVSNVADTIEYMMEVFKMFMGRIIFNSEGEDDLIDFSKMTSSKKPRSSVGVNIKFHIYMVVNFIKKNSSEEGGGYTVGKDQYFNSTNKFVNGVSLSNTLNQLQDEFMTRIRNHEDQPGSGWSMFSVKMGHCFVDSDFDNDSDTVLRGEILGNPQSDFINDEAECSDDDDDDGDNKTNRIDEEFIDDNNHDVDVNLLRRHIYNYETEYKKYYENKRFINNRKRKLEEEKTLDKRIRIKN